MAFGMLRVLGVLGERKWSFLERERERACVFYVGNDHVFVESDGWNEWNNIGDGECYVFHMVGTLFIGK